MSDSGGTRYPAEWQRKAIWAAVSALAISFLIFVFVAAVWIMANVISFLQPILIPVAIAAILAYLLDPVVTEWLPVVSVAPNPSFCFLPLPGWHWRPSAPGWCPRLGCRAIVLLKSCRNTPSKRATRLSSGCIVTNKLSAPAVRSGRRPPAE